MQDAVDYGNLNKRIVFTENDHRQVQLKMKLKTIGVTQSEFFRLMITGMLTGDSRIYSYLDDAGPLSKKRKRRSKIYREQGKEISKSLGLGSEEVESIFDLIAEEHPGL
jgi:hypothetical protein